MRRAIVRLAFLAPDIVAAILAGKQPAGAHRQQADGRHPLAARLAGSAHGVAGRHNPKVHPLPFDPWLPASGSLDHLSLRLCGMQLMLVEQSHVPGLDAR